MAQGVPEMRRRTTRTPRSPRPATPRQATTGKPLGAVLEFMRALWGVNHGLESTSRRMQSRLGVTGPERMVIRLVGCHPGIAAGELARLLRVHPSTLTARLRRLMRKGLLVRGEDTADARRALFTLTLRGLAIDANQRGTVEAVVRATLASLPAADVRKASKVLDALERAFGG